MYIIPYTNLFLFDKISTTKQQSTARLPAESEQIMKIKVVGLNPDKVFIQIKIKFGWKQVELTKDEFKQLMYQYFEKYIDEYINSNSDYDFCNWCYYYGESEEDTYIFE